MRRTRTIAIQPAEMAPALSRRRALQLMGAALALSAGGCGRAPRERIVPWVDMPEAGVHDAPLYYATAWVRDGHAQGVLVGTRDGRPIKIEGNPAHPSSLGATDAPTQASVLDLWDPDRAQVVQQRLGPQAPSVHGPVPEQLPLAAASTWNAFEAAWRAREPALAADGGSRLRILSAPFTSPTLRAQRAEVQARYPNARWHEHAPDDVLAARAGARLAFGRDVATVLHLERARFVATFDADPFSHGPGRVRQARDWATQRAAAHGSGLSPSGGSAVAPAATTFAFETTPGLFGARADLRLALAPAAIEALLWRVAARLHADLAAPGMPRADDAATARAEARLVEALQRHGAESLLVAGPSLGAASHALVHVLNQRLGAFGRTLDAIAPLDALADAGTLAELVEAMQAGEVDTLLVLDANPVYDAPGDVPFAAALDRVAFSAHLGLHRDETARHCTWSLPATHGYEQWSDALAHDGTASVIQPTLAPLYDTRSAHEVLAWIAGADGDAHARVRRQWRDRAGADADFEAWWLDTLRRGLVAGSASAPLRLEAAQRPEPPDLGARHAPGLPEVTAVFVADPSAGTGAQANNAWLHELPRPLTHLTWDNALHLGPASARALGVTTGDVVLASAGAARIEAPVWVQRGHAEGAATLPLGYGRRNVGRTGHGVGFDAHPLRRAAGGPVTLRLERTGRHHDFAVTQRDTAQHGRDLARSVPPGGRIEKPDTGHPSLYPPSPAGREHAWAMAIDLDACIGCGACSVACQAENNIPVVGAEEVARGRHMHWIRVDRYDATPPGASETAPPHRSADEAQGASVFQPVPCMHCEHAPCELVCPVGATVHDSDGLNVQVYNRCIGTRFCSNNCPYKVRRFNFLQYADEDTESLKAQRNPEVTVRERGVMEKCTYCLQRIVRARLHLEERGSGLHDGDVVTACQAACPTQAIRFGDLLDPAAEVVRAKASPRHYALLGELNTRPRTTYLARVATDEDETS